MSSSGHRFSYGGDPSASPRDAVRFLVGDTNEKRPLLDDREVDHGLTKYNDDENLAAAFLCEHLWGKFGSKADFAVGPVNKAYSKVAQSFKDKAAQLRAEAGKFVIPSFPATSLTEKDNLSNDDEARQPEFLVGMFDNPFAVQLNENLNTARFNGFGS